MAPQERTQSQTLPELLGMSKILYNSGYWPMEFIALLVSVTTGYLIVHAHFPIFTFCIKATRIHFVRQK